MTGEFPEAMPGRPLWLVTLADLALLLVGFFVLMQASEHADREALARGIREGFGAAAGPVDDSVPAAMPAVPMPVAIAGMTDFTAGSARLPGSPAGLIAWSREALRDPRVTLRISGATDGSPMDVDPATGSGALLAADRARAVAAVLAAAHAVPADRMTIVNAPDAPRPGRRAVFISLGFAGARP